MPVLDAHEIKRIDQILQDWSQGDAALQENWFVHVADPSQALTQSSAEATGSLQALTTDVEGLVVISQSCDIARTCEKRPFVEIAPLVKVDDVKLVEIRKGQRPTYTYIPGTAQLNLVADLDRAMTVEKSVLAGWQRTPGCLSDEERRALALSLARKFSRRAFPDDFTQFASGLQARIKEKYSKRTVEGDGLRSLREIRVRAAPSWDSPKVEIIFWFIRDDNNGDEVNWSVLLTAWLKLVPSSGRFYVVDGAVVLLDDMTGRDYFESDPLDLDYLSNSTIPL